MNNECGIVVGLVGFVQTCLNSVAQWEHDYKVGFGSSRIDRIPCGIVNFCQKCIFLVFLGAKTTPLSDVPQTDFCGLPFIRDSQKFMRIAIKRTGRAQFCHVGVVREDSSKAEFMFIFRWLS